jgi:hypothetical protein
LQNSGPLNEAFRLCIFGALAGALVGGLFAVQIISTWLVAYEPRLLAAFGAVFGGVVGATMGAVLGRVTHQPQH